jgi:predicted acylesterase/phospholipase RssA
MPEPKKELRLALGMRGGVSLAVWIGGACAEIDELRRTRGGGAEFWSTCLEESAFDRVVVDVMAGASAGGLNGVLFASGIRFGFPMSVMGDIWRRVADIDQLRRVDAPWMSVLDGDGVFLDRVHTELATRVPAPSAPPPGTFLDLRLSATLVEPVLMSTVGPDDETLSRKRSSATFHFQCAADDPVSTDDFVGDERALWRLSLAARATASFPGAFEPAVVRSNRPASFGGGPSHSPKCLVDCGSVFSERQGPQQIGAACESDLLVADGGIVDNIPLGKAIDAIVEAPADGPTKRYLLYLHPTGPEQLHPTSSGDSPPPKPIEKRRGVDAVARGAMAARITAESIAGDISQIEAQQQVAGVARALRAEFMRKITERVATLESLVDAQRSAYEMQRVVLEATQIRCLLDDPIGVLGADPFPVPPPAPYANVPESDVWRAPLTVYRYDERRPGGFGWCPKARGQLDAGLIKAIIRESGSCLPLGAGALQRVTRLTIEWIRALEDACGDRRLGSAKRDLYRLLWLLQRVFDPLRSQGWVVRAGCNLPDRGGVQGWCTRSVELLDQFFMVSRRRSDALVQGKPLVTKAYRATCERALDALVLGSLDEFRLQLSANTEAGDVVDLRNSILAAIGALVTGVIGLNVPGLPAKSPAALLDCVLRHAGSVEDRLTWLEILCFPEYAAGSRGGEPIEFRRISAAADTPLALCFKQLIQATGELYPEWRGGLHPNVKLAGNELSNFSAFFKTEWRENDWMWGRLDAVPALFDILLPDAAPNHRMDRIAERQREIIAEQRRIRPDQVNTDMADYAIGLEKLDESFVPGLADSVDGLASSAAHVAAAFAPEVLQGHLVGWVGHVARLTARRLVRAKTPASDTAPAAGGGKRSALGPRLLWWVLTILASILVPAITFPPSRSHWPRAKQPSWSASSPASSSGPCPYSSCGEQWFAPYACRRARQPAIPGRRVPHEIVGLGLRHLWTCG